VKSALIEWCAVWFYVLRDDDGLSALGMLKFSVIYGLFDLGTDCRLSNFRDRLIPEVAA
jgi:hypothetical protein